MDNKKAKMILEGVLFSMGESVEIGRLADVIGYVEERLHARLFIEMLHSFF